MSLFASPLFLRRVLWADAASCVATGAVQVGLNEPLAHLLHLPAALLMVTGVFLLAYAAAVLVVAGRAEPARAVVGTIVLGNFGWAAGCVALLAVGGLAPTAAGVAWVLAQAVTVVLLAELQWTCLRRAPAPGWA